MRIEKGQAAPDFSLYDTTKNRVTLAESRGQNVLLLFFPLAFTRVCTAELCAVRDNIGLYDKAHATVFGISVDSVYTLARFKEEQQLTFSLLSDFNKEVSAAYGALYDTWALDIKGVSKRAAFVIGRDGIVRYAEVLEIASALPDFSAIHETLAGLT